MIEKLLASSRKKNAIIIVFMFLVLLSSLFNSYINYVENKNTFFSSIDKMLKNTALHYNILLGEDFHDKALEKNSISPKEDLENILKTSKYINSVDAIYAYTTIVKDNKIYFTSSSSTEEEIRTKEVTYYFDHYEDADKALFSIMEQNKTLFLNINDKWGTFRSINIPLQTKLGNKYILSADIEISFINDALNNHIKQIIILQSIFVIFLIIISLYLIRVSKKEIKEIDKLKHNLESMNQQLEDKVYEKTKELDKSLKVFGENVITLNTDLKGIITYASPALCSISQYSQEELLGKSHNILNIKHISDIEFQNILNTIASNAICTEELQKKTKEGKLFWLQTSTVPQVDRVNKVIGYTSISHDITAQKAKEGFMANMSHELRTPLNAIIGFSSILHNKLIESELKKLSEQINISSKFLLSLINDILDLSKIQNSNFTINPYEFNAYDEVLSCSKQIEGLISEKSLNFTNTISEKLKGTFFGDFSRIKQIILNLISNAIKFTPENGNISSSFEHDDDFLIITVSDTGIGMNDEIQDRIFQPFEQADGSTTRKYGGTGLGLSITQTLVEVMQGSIELQSQENVGTTFKIKIPLSKINDTQENVYTDEDISLDKENTLKGHVLVAEDNKTNQMLITMLLDDFGISCDVANDGLEAIQMYKENKHQLILMNENMPNMNGLSAMKILHEKYKENCPPIIALTANTMQGDEARFLDAGMDGYIAKPIDEDKLYTLLSQFLST